MSGIAEKIVISVTTLALGSVPYAVDAQGPARSAVERSAATRSDAANYLKSKAAEFEANDKALAAAGTSRDFVQLYRLLKDRNSFGGRPVMGKSAREQAQIRDALTQTAAYYLAATGTTPSDVARLTRAGYDPLSAVERVIAGGSTLEDDLAIAETPVFGRLVESVVSGPGLGERKLTFTIERNVKGKAGLARQVSFAVTPSHPLGFAGKGTSCLLLLSDTLGRFRTASGKPRSSTTFQQQLEPYCRTGPAFRRLSFEPSASIPVAEMTAALERLARAK